MSELHRYATANDLTEGAAQALLEALVGLQAGGHVAELCLTGGRIANRVYERLGALVEGSELDPGRLELWWGDERFLPTDDPERNAGQTLALLAGRRGAASARRLVVRAVADGWAGRLGPISP